MPLPSRAVRAIPLLGLLLAVATASPAIAQSVADYPAAQVAAHTWVIHGPAGLPSKTNLGFMNNPGFVVSANSVIVIDPGASAETGKMVIRAIGKITAKPVTHVFATHIHGDHWLANQAIADAFPQARFFAHPKMIEQAEDGEARTWLNLLTRMTEGAIGGTRALIPSEAVSDGESLRVDDIELRVLASDHAHTRTDIMIEVVEDAVMFLGDNVVNQRMGRMDDGSFRGNIEACERARTTAARVFVPGHGPTGDAASTLGFCDYLVALYEAVGDLIEEGLEDFEMKPILEPRFKRYTRWNGFGTGLGRHISLAVLEHESASFE